MKLQLRRASLEDITDILRLYTFAYEGTYPDSTFTDVDKLISTISSGDKFLFVATAENDKVIASLLFNYDRINKLGKAGGAIVDTSFRGQNITQKLLKYGIDFINNCEPGIDVLYITTRTVHKAAQVLTQKMGFLQLGIFPNVHKTKDYETHALAAMYFNGACEKRFTDFEQHPDIGELFNIVRENITLPEMSVATEWMNKNYEGVVPILEVIKAKEFIKLRMKNLSFSEEIDLAFFPFHTPNILITSPDQKIELFAYVNEIDKHCVITGCKIDREVSFTDLFLKVSNILRDRGIRYIEVIIRANRLNIIDKISKAKFIPCGYVPAFQLEGDKRYDYVVFSRSFEILDFNNLQLTGANAKYLQNYVELWEKRFLGNYFQVK